MPVAANGYVYVARATVTCLPGGGDWSRLPVFRANRPGDRVRAACRVQLGRPPKGVGCMTAMCRPDSGGTPRVADIAHLEVRPFSGADALAQLGGGYPSSPVLHESQQQRDRGSEFQAAKVEVVQAVPLEGLDELRWLDEHLPHVKIRRRQPCKPPLLHQLHDDNLAEQGPVDRVVEKETVGLEDACDLSYNCVPVSNVLEHVAAVNDLEALVFERKRRSVPEAIVDVQTILLRVRSRN